ncbi:TnsA endonuclease N-terminal domain-containing protein [Primorskyibacter flagellatus]|uniref:TnsA endonuclease N-terminal domain-containing protein n=1 Tax=Primorskyibacter flagellatus TaxID=1387277 RepID=UPI003A902768
MTDSLIYRAAEPSRATRKVVRRSKASLRGSMIAKLPAFPRPRVIHFESMLEYRFLCLMLVQPDVYDIQEQPTAIRYRRHDGSQGTHVFDFLVTRTDGSRTAVAIKPLRRVESRNFNSELALVAASVTKDFADRIKLVTDAQLDRHAATKAERQLMRDRPSLTEVAA